jgi:large subunit ribosomal protein L33
LTQAAVGLWWASEVASPGGTGFYWPSATASVRNKTMAKQNTVLIKLISTADTGYFYVKKKNPKKTTEKLSFRKYDPVARKHVDFKESKMK